MNAFSGTVITRAAPDRSVQERLRNASRDLAEAVAAQRAAVQSLRDNMAALENVLDKMEASFRNAHDRLGASSPKADPIDA